MINNGVSVPLPRRRSADFLLSRKDALRPVLQPVVDVTTSAVAGYEALARVRPHYPQMSPAQIFAWARQQGKVNEVDWACRCAAFRVAAEAGVLAPMALLVNAEPAALDAGAPEALLPDLRHARHQLRVMVELTERELADDPVRLFRVVDSMRAFGWELAIDDVGAEPVSLALLPLLEPDVIKLDRAVVAYPTEPRHALTAVAVAAEAARTGATVIAEGVETHEQLEIARGLGATFAQGFLWGQPKPAARHDLIDAPMPVRRHGVVGVARERPEFEARPMRTGELDALIEVLLTVAGAEATGVVLAGYPADATADRWRRMLASLAASCPVVGSYTTHDRRCELVVLSPATTAMISARSGDRPDQWDVAASYRRPLVVREAQRVIRLVTRMGAVLSHPPAGGALPNYRLDGAQPELSNPAGGRRGAAEPP